jgi:DNA-binding response OmpR family regulator
MPLCECESPPDLLCFDFDRPRPETLRALQRTKRDYPALPILMLTAQESEPVAIWALRNRVWDYLRKPVTGRDLAIRVARLRALLEAGRTRPSRALITPEPANVTAGPAGNTAPALGYIDDHYQEKILLDQVAGECGMGRFEFSRAFKREQGVTFREFVAN